MLECQMYIIDLINGWHIYNVFMIGSMSLYFNYSIFICSTGSIPHNSVYFSY